MTKVNDLFDVRYGHSLELNRLVILKSNDGIAFVSRKMRDNGVSAIIQKVPSEIPAKPGEISVALGGNGVLSAFLQERPFYTGRDVAILSPKKKMSKAVILYYCMCITANRYRFSYGRQANRTLGLLKIPRLSEVPKYVFKANVDMYDGASAPAISKRIPLTRISLWKPYKIGELFEIKKGKRLTKAHMIPGSTPYVGAIDKNNGISSFIEQKPRHSGNVITVSYNGSVGEAYYQPNPFWATDDVNVLYPKFSLTPEIAMFLLAVIRHEKYRFNYGRKWTMERMRESIIYLPSDKDGCPMWKNMSAFIMGRKFSSSIC